MDVVNKNTTKRILFLAGIGLLTAQTAAAEPTGGFRGLTGPWASESPRGWGEANLLAAQAGASQGSGRPSLPSASQAAKPAQAPAWYGRNELHKYFGLGSIGFAGLTFLSPKTEDGPHAFFARGAAALGVAAVATGLFAHWDDLDANWRNPDTQHALLGALGTLGFLAAVAQGGKEGHAGLGALGTVSMAVAIKLVW